MLKVRDQPSPQRVGNVEGKTRDLREIFIIQKLPELGNETVQPLLSTKLTALPRLHVYHQVQQLCKQLICQTEIRHWPTKPLIQLMMHLNKVKGAV